MKKMLLLLTVGLLAGSLGVMGAYFTGEADVPENVIRAGSVGVSAEPTSSALSIDALAPGTTAARSMTVVNNGTMPASIVVTGAKKAGITDFYEALTTTVRVNGQAVYSGKLSALRTLPVVLAPGARQQLQFTVGLPATAGNELADDYAKVTLYVDAEQAH